jgi:hypothetical protein
VAYFLKHLVHFVIDTKPVDTSFYTWMVSGIFDLAKFAFFILRKCCVYRPCFRRNLVYMVRGLKLPLTGIIKAQAADLLSSTSAVVTFYMQANPKRILLRQSHPQTYSAYQ